MTNRVDAWKQLRSLRLEAAEAKSASDAAGLFQKRLGLSLDDLVVLYAHPGWKGSPYGGNAWLPVASRAIDLRNLIDAGKESEAVELAGLILQSPHNTGNISEKLCELERLTASLGA